MRFTLCTAIITAVAVATVASAASDTDPQNEATFLRIPSSSGARASSRVINERYHYPGTPGDYRLAVYMRDAMRGFGLRAWIEAFPATVYTPRILQLQLLTSPVVTFDLRDQKIAADPDGSRPDAGLPFNAGSGSGDVRAPVVYAGRGLDADYATLTSAGVGVRGRIVLIRYGAEYRGNLAARAAAHGAAGVIFYSDPKDDGSGRGGVYPNGPYRPAGAVQRGDVMGDDHQPLHIPTLPVTAITAQRLLAEMRGGSVTQVPVRLHVEMIARRTTLWNTIGEITGANPNQMVILGGHRDAWVYGVSDDGSGISTLLEVARGLGVLHRRGWVPRRTIRIAGWDAEEIGELGSAAYVAMHRSELQRGLIAYVNTDESASGPKFGAAAAGALLPALTPAVQQVLHIANPQVDVPAGGSDFESFIYTLGTPILDLGYTGPFGTYHSPYDDYRYASLYADPGFTHHRTIAQAIGIIAMRMADAQSLPYRFEPYVQVLGAGLQTLTKSAEQAQLTIDPVLGNAIGNFGNAARAYDTSPQSRNDALALNVAQQLDLLAYSANGYASVAFPAVAAAIATGHQSAVDTSVHATVTTLNAVTALLTGKK
jgi:N-acetylated-alpha-linked acidic dipeptidase